MLHPYTLYTAQSTWLVHCRPLLRSCNIPGGKFIREQLSSSQQRLTDDVRRNNQVSVTKNVWHRVDDALHVQHLRGRMPFKVQSVSVDIRISQHDLCLSSNGGASGREAGPHVILRVE
jgi:hypothetical protein